MGPKARTVKFYCGVSDRIEVVHLISRLFSGDGGPGSGNHNHAGRPGKVGGSAPKGGGGELKSEASEKPKSRFPAYHAKKRLEKVDEEIAKITGKGEVEVEDLVTLMPLVKEKEELSRKIREAEVEKKKSEEEKPEGLKAPKQAIAMVLFKLNPLGEEGKIRDILSGAMKKLDGDDITKNDIDEACIRIDAAIGRLEETETKAFLEAAKIALKRERESGKYRRSRPEGEEETEEERVRPKTNSDQERYLRNMLEKAGHIDVPESPTEFEWSDREEQAILKGKPEELYGFYFSNSIQDTDWYDQLNSQFFPKLSERERAFLKYVHDDTDGKDALEREYGYIYGDAPDDLKKYYLCLMQKATGGGFPLSVLSIGHQIAPQKSPYSDLVGEKEARFAPPPKDAQKTLGRYKDHYSREFGFVKENYHLKAKDIKEAEGIVSQILDKNEFGMFIDPKYVEDALKDHFKNQMETGTSRGSYNPEKRKTISRNLFGTNKDETKPEEYEKYGCLMQNATGEGTSGRGYGGCSVTFKKDRMAGRVTYTLTDSFAADGPAGSASVGEGVTLGGSLSPQRTIENLKKIPSTKYGDLDTVLSMLHSPYIELQYHGKLTIDDVDSIFFPSEADCYSNLTNGMLQSLKDKGVKVYYDAEGGVKNAEVGKSFKRG